MQMERQIFPDQNDRLLFREYSYWGNSFLSNWPSPSMTDTFDRYDVTIGGITWHVKDGCFLKSLSAKQSSW